MDENKYSVQERALALFKFTKELNALKQKTYYKFSDYPWHKAINAIHEDRENIKITYRDRTEAEEGELSSVLFSVHKPEHEKCPQPDQDLLKWLEPGWDDYYKETKVLQRRVFDKSGQEIFNWVEPKQAQPEQLSLLGTVESTEDQYKIEEKSPDEDVTIILFEENADRVAAYDAWKNKRAVWAERQKMISATRSLFMEFYQQYIELQRDIEYEMIVANGELIDRDSDIDQVVLTRRVMVRYDPIKNTITVEDTDNNTDLYSVLFQAMPDINLDKLGDLRDKLMQYDYHPLDRNDTPDYLMEMVRYFSSESLFCKDEVPENWQKEHRYLMKMNPVFITRKRVDGTLKAIDSILQKIEETGFVPDPIRELVAGGFIEIPEDPDDLSIEEQLAEVGGESKDILLSKAANREQLEIAKRIEAYNAVLVQGPPGTGKTHTIANLTGHFLAKGKSVLITSYTSKALNVLKEKVPEGIQSLCVSVLDDSNADMEKSVDGISDYMANHSSGALHRKMGETQAKRAAIMKELSETRKRLFALINQEYSSIVINGEGISPSRAAAFVVEHAEDLSYIPGKVLIGEPLPLTVSELADLYHSNTALTEDEEAELDSSLPCPEELLSPEDFSAACETIQKSDAAIQKIAANMGWAVSNSRAAQSVYYRFDGREFTVPYSGKQELRELLSFIQSFETAEPWMIQAAVDGRKGGQYVDRWNMLLNQIEDTSEFSDSIVSHAFGRRITYSETYHYEEYEGEFIELEEKFKAKGKISRFLLKKRLSEALESVRIDGEEISSADDCRIFLDFIMLDKMRNQCAAYWDALLVPFGVTPFSELDRSDPEHVAKNWIPLIERYLGWYKEDYKELRRLLSLNHMPEQDLFGFSQMDSDTTVTEKILQTVIRILPAICKCQYAALVSSENIRKIDRQTATISEVSMNLSPSCMRLLQATEDRNPAAYSTAYHTLGTLYCKYTLQAKRKELLEKLQPFAPQWAEAIANREGIHGKSTFPDDILDAWKWKQLSGKLEEINAQPYSELQKKSVQLSRNYRAVTAEYAEYSAWYHLLRRTEQDLTMKQALQGWKQAVKSIGKGTGNKKRIAELRSSAKRNMAICQKAVPAWIMPIGKVLDNFVPGDNTFDIVIIDEASQADLSSLAILYMGKKLIIVGDDKQVSPMAVGSETEKMIALQNEYIRDKIPNASLYDSKRSIYDIAMTTFQPLMLREHFRCVPEIIGFSNMLSYDYKIKPLRDAGSSNLLPAVVNYRVADGKRLEPRKVNPREALTIVALIKACMEQPEYDGKTFGVISLLGDDQAKAIQQLLVNHIDQRELEKRCVLCGNSANFQGDERDVIFLSVVDSNEGTGPLRMVGEGVDQATKKRYNVAVSRAKDQLWVVDSLDAANDLQPNDMRKRLIDYSLNPEGFAIKAQQIEHDSESPFEEGVAKALTARGYHLVQQWKVGAYRLDMVALCGEKKVVIECDGERWHSGEEKIREDMERQCILERSGWRFIRIRGSEYFRDPEKTIERVLTELSSFGIQPEESVDTQPEGRTTELLERVKARAGLLLRMMDGEEDPIDPETILIGLGGQVPGISEPVVPGDDAGNTGKPGKDETPVSPKDPVLEPEEPEKPISVPSSAMPEEPIEGIPEGVNTDKPETPSFSVATPAPDSDKTGKGVKDAPSRSSSRNNTAGNSFEDILKNPKGSAGSIGSTKKTDHSNSISKSNNSFTDLLNQVKNKKS